MKPQHTIFENKIQLNKAILCEVATYITTLQKSNSNENTNLIKSKKFPTHDELQIQQHDDKDPFEFANSRTNIPSLIGQNNYENVGLDQFDNKNNREYLLNSRKLEFETEYESKKQEFKDLFQRKQPNHVDFKESMDVKGNVSDLLQNEINMRNQFDKTHEDVSKKPSPNTQPTTTIN